jgi:hypothetical protein
MELIATVPAAGATAAADTPLIASVRLAPRGRPEGLRLTLDGEDVTARCALRTDLAQPPRRADLVLAGPLAPGEHEAVVSWPEAAGAPREHAWRFAVGAGGPAPARG